MPKQIPYSFSIGHCILKSKEITSTKSVVLRPLGGLIGNMMATMHLAILSRWLSSMRIVPRPSSASARHWEQLSSKSQWLAHKWSLQTAPFFISLQLEAADGCVPEEKDISIGASLEGEGGRIKGEAKEEGSYVGQRKVNHLSLGEQNGIREGKKSCKIGSTNIVQEMNSVRRSRKIKVEKTKKERNKKNTCSRIHPFLLSHKLAIQRQEGRKKRCVTVFNWKRARWEWPKLQPGSKYEFVSAEKLGGGESNWQQIRLVWFCLARFPFSGHKMNKQRWVGICLSSCRHTKETALERADTLPFSL